MAFNSAYSWSSRRSSFFQRRASKMFLTVAANGTLCYNFFNIHTTVGHVVGITAIGAKVTFK